VRSECGYLGAGSHRNQYRFTGGTAGKFSRPVTCNLSRTRPVTLGRFAWFVVAYNIAVILWGAYVRATGSGAGCGSHWHLCNGAILPGTNQTQTLIEFTHRVTSAASLVLVAILLILCWRRTAIGDWPRYSAIAATELLFNEAFLGALLVLLDRIGGLDGSAVTLSFCACILGTPCCCLPRWH